MAAIRRGCRRRWSASRCRAFTLPPIDGLDADGAAVGLQPRRPRARASRPSSMCGRHGACPVTTSIRCCSSSPSSRASASTASTTRTTRRRRGAFSAATAIPSPASAPTASGRVGHRLRRLWRARDLCDRRATARSPTAMSGPLTEDAIKDKLLPLVQPSGSQAARLTRRLFASVAVDDQIERCRGTPAAWPAAARRAAANRWRRRRARPRASPSSPASVSLMA